MIFAKGTPLTQRSPGNIHKSIFLHMRKFLIKIDFVSVIVTRISYPEIHSFVDDREQRSATKLLFGLRIQIC